MLLQILLIIVKSILFNINETISMYYFHLRVIRGSFKGTGKASLIIFMHDTTDQTTVLIRGHFHFYLHRVLSLSICFRLLICRKNGRKNTSLKLMLKKHLYDVNDVRWFFIAVEKRESSV